MNALKSAIPPSARLALAGLAIALAAGCANPTDAADSLPPDARLPEMWANERKAAGS